MSTPSVTHVYQNHHLDSTRWDAYKPRDGDIIVTTSYKAGTTFAQKILLHLLHGAEDEIPSLEVSPWIDARFDPTPLAELHARIEAQTFRRSVKSHLPLDGLPYYENVKYIVVGRDARDVFMSFANHYGNYTKLAYAAINDSVGRVGDPLPPFEENLTTLWRNWISRGWFEWESEGYPFWGNMHHIQSYWDYRHLPNLLFLHYSDMLADLEGCVRQLAEFIEQPISDADVARVAAATNFDAAKKEAEELDANADENEPRIFRGGRSSFIFKGTNGRWRDVLDAEDLALYEAAKTRVLSNDCARWLEEGASASGDTA